MRVILDGMQTSLFDHLETSTDLTKLTDADLCDRVQSGDREAADVIVRRHSGLVGMVIARNKMRYDPRVDLDEMMVIGQAALLRAAKGWRPDRGARYNTFATWAVINALSRELDRTASRKYKIGEPSGHDMDRLCSRQPREVPNLHLDVLDPVSRTAVELHYGLRGEAMGTGLIARELGLPSTYHARELINEALNKLRGAALVGDDDGEPAGFR